MRTRALSESEVNQVLLKLDQLRDRCLFLLGVKTGFRISELLSLTQADVTTATITVHRKNMKGRRRSRTIPIHPAAQELLNSYTKTLSGGDGVRLFPITRKHAWRILTKAYQQLGLTGKIGTHGMRKTFGMRIYEKSGKDIVAAQQALGHSSLASTTYYLSIGQEQVDRLILES